MDHAQFLPAISSNRTYVYFSLPQVFQQDSWRLGSYRSYVEPLLGDPDLKGSITVLTYAEAERLVMDGDKRVTGLQVRTHAQGELVHQSSSTWICVFGGSWVP